MYSQVALQPQWTLMWSVLGGLPNMFWIIIHIENGNIPSINWDEYEKAY